MEGKWKWAITAVNEYSRTTSGVELDASSNDHFGVIEAH